MNTAELKLDIFRRLDTLDDNLFQEIYGYVINYISGIKPFSESIAISEEEKMAIEEGYAQIRQGKGILHSEIMEKYRAKYA